MSQAKAHNGCVRGSSSAETSSATHPRQTQWTATDDLPTATRERIRCCSSLFPFLLQALQRLLRKRHIVKRQLPRFDQVSHHRPRLPSEKSQQVFPHPVLRGFARNYRRKEMKVPHLPGPSYRFLSLQTVHR